MGDDKPRRHQIRRVLSVRYKCPICGDPNAYPLWIGDPPEGCAHDPSWHDGSVGRIKNVTQCKYQMDKAWRQSEWRRLCPDAFDESGNILPGNIGRVLAAFAAEHPGAYFI